MALHGKANNNGSAINSGDLRVLIYDASSGGNLVYDSGSDFNNSINNGIFDVVLGSGVPLDLNYGSNYWLDLEINGVDLDFGGVERKKFEANHGLIENNDLSNNASISWSKIDKTGSNLSDFGFDLDFNHAFVSQVDGNNFYVLASDGNQWYYTRSDANAIFVKQEDGNNWYARKNENESITGDWDFSNGATFNGGFGSNGVTIQDGVAYVQSLVIVNDFNAATIQGVDINGHHTPSINNTFDLGSDSKRWRTIYGADANFNSISVPANAIDWVFVNKTGSNLTDLETRNHNDLQNIQGGQANEYYHLTALQHTNLTALNGVWETINSNQGSTTPNSFPDSLNIFGSDDINVSINGDTITIDFNGVTNSSNDTNWSTSWSVFDANMQHYYALKNDVNTWINQNTYGSTDFNNTYLNNTNDTNWSTNWNIFDANMQHYYALKNDVNNWINDLTWGSTDFNNTYLNTNSNDSNVWSEGFLDDNNALTQDLNGGNHNLINFNDANFSGNVYIDGNIWVDGNYLCDSINCYLISDLNAPVGNNQEIQFNDNGVRSGSRLKYDKANNSLLFGSSITSTGDYSVTIGTNNSNASGEYAIAGGLNSVASGSASIAFGSSARAETDYSFAFGSSAHATGIVSHAIGSNTTASGSYSFASGSDTTASGNSSFAGGSYTEAKGIGSFVFGRGKNFMDYFGAGNSNNNQFLIGSNDSGKYYKVGINVEVPTDALDIQGGAIGLRELNSTPTSTNNFGKIYSKSNDGKLYYLDENGNEYNLVSQSSGTDSNVWSEGWLDDNNALTNDLNGGNNNLYNFNDGNINRDFNIHHNLYVDGNVWVDGNYLCDSINCYLINDLNSSGSPSGNTGDIQFNNAGVFGSSSDLNWNDSSKTLTLNANSDYDVALKLIAGTEEGNIYVTQSGAFNILGTSSISMGINPYTNLILTSNGRVSIGDPTADELLHVHGNTKIDNNLYINEFVGVGTNSPGFDLDVNGDTNSHRFCLQGTCISNWSEISSGTDSNVWSEGWLDDNNALTTDLNGGNNNLYNFNDGNINRDFNIHRNLYVDGNIHSGEGTIVLIGSENKMGVGVENPTESIETDGNVKIDGNYLCDSLNCYLISDLATSNGTDSNVWSEGWLDDNNAFNYDLNLYKVDLNQFAGDPIHAGSINDNSTTALSGAIGVFVQDNYAYVASYSDNGLEILDISDPTNPTHVGKITDGGPRQLAGAYNVFVSGKYAYVTAFSDDGLEIIDVSDPTNPKHVGKIDDDASTILRSTSGVFVQGNYAYVLSASEDGLQIIDVSDPSNPVALGSITDDASTELDDARGIYVRGKYAYIASQEDDGVEIIDVSDPNNPTHVGAITDNSTTALNGAVGIFVQGKYAYVTSYYDDGLEILDISDPTNPTHVGKITDNAERELDGATNVFVAGKYAYIISQTDNGVEVVDVSNPTNPIHAGSITDAGSMELESGRSIFVKGNYAFIASFVDNGLEVLKLTGTNIPTLETGSIKTGTLQVDSLALINNHLSVTGGLEVGSNLKISNSLSAMDNNFSVTKKGNDVNVNINANLCLNEDCITSWNTNSGTDTNWSTNWTEFDNNMQHYYTLKNDTNTWINQNTYGSTDFNNTYLNTNSNDSNVWSENWLDDNNALTQDLNGGNNNIYNFKDGNFNGVVRANKFETNGSRASGDYSIAIGNDVLASGITSISVGSNTDASGDYSVSFGSDSSASGNASVAMGDTSNASNYSSMAFGAETRANGNTSVAMGNQTTANGNSSMAMGNQTTANGNSSMAMGIYSVSGGNNSIAMGLNARTDANNSIAIGTNAKTTIDANNGVAIGHNAISNKEDLIVLSRDVNISRDLNIGNNLEVKNDVNSFRLCLSGNCITSWNTNNDTNIWNEGHMDGNTYQYPLTIKGTNNNSSILNLHAINPTNIDINFIVTDEELNTGYSASIGSMGFTIYDNGIPWIKTGTSDNDWNQLATQEYVNNQISNSSSNNDTNIWSEGYMDGNTYQYPLTINGTTSSVLTLRNSIKDVNFLISDDRLVGKSASIASIGFSEYNNGSIWVKTGTSDNDWNQLATQEYVNSKDSNIWTEGYTNNSLIDWTNASNNFKTSGTGRFEGELTTYGITANKTVTLNDKLVSNNGCGIPNATFIAEENSTLEPDSYEWSMGNGDDPNYGTYQACSGTITAMSVICDYCSNEKSTVGIKIDSTTAECKTDVDTLETSISSDSYGGYTTNCEDSFSAGQTLRFYTIDDDGSCGGCVATMWVRYD